MRKLYVLGLTLTAVFAFFAVAAASAFAESEWLVEESPLTVALLAETEGEGLELIAYKSETSDEELNRIRCASGLFDGFIGPGSLDLITEVLNLSNVKIALGSSGLSCEVTFSAGELGDCAVGTTEVEVWPEDLPWSTEIVLSGTTFLDLLKADGNGAPGWTALCLSSRGLDVENTCTGEFANATLTNEANTPNFVLGEFNAVQLGAGGTGSERANCSLTGNHTGDVRKGAGKTWAVEGTTKLKTEVS